jgi:hypothetical protein
MLDLPPLGENAMLGVEEEREGWTPVGAMIWVSKPKRITYEVQPKWMAARKWERW